MAYRPLLDNMSPNEILDAAERWQALMSAEQLVWKSHAGYDGDTYPTNHPDDRFLSVAMWTRLHDPLHVRSAETCTQTRELLTQFADKMRSIVAQDAIVAPSKRERVVQAECPTTDLTLTE